MAESKKSRIVLDIGCGNGYELAERAREHPEITYIGVDISPSSIRQAKGRYGNLPNIHFSVGDASQLGISSQTVDEVTARYLFSRLEGRIMSREELAYKVAREIERVLKPNGEVKAELSLAEEKGRIGKEALKKILRVTEERVVPYPAVPECQTIETERAKKGEGIGLIRFRKRRRK